MRVPLNVCWNKVEHHHQGLICTICSITGIEESNTIHTSPITHNSSGRVLSRGHRDNICCLLTHQLTPAMRKDSTLRQMLSQKKDCQNLYGSEYWQVSCGQPAHAGLHTVIGNANLRIAQCRIDPNRQIITSRRDSNDC